MVCTANQCRSVMAEQILRRELLERSTAANAGQVQAEVESVGLLSGGEPATERTMRAMRELGFDVSGHRSRQVGPSVLYASLILTMTAEQTRGVVNLDRRLWAITFPLRDLLARAVRVGPRSPGQDLGAWIAAVHDGRTWQDSLDTSRDIPDPTGQSMARHRRLAAELMADLGQLAGLLFAPAQPAGDGTARFIRRER